MKKYIVFDSDDCEWIVIAEGVLCDVRGILTFFIGKDVIHAFNTQHWSSVKEVPND